MKHLLLIPLLAIFAYICLYDANLETKLIKKDRYLHECVYYYADARTVRGNCNDTINIK